MCLEAISTILFAAAISHCTLRDDEPFHRGGTIHDSVCLHGLIILGILIQIQDPDLESTMLALVYLLGLPSFLYLIPRYRISSPDIAL